MLERVDSDDKIKATYHLSRDVWDFIHIRSHEKGMSKSCYIETLVREDMARRRIQIA